jgi:hypothetical protein
MFLHLKNFKTALNVAMKPWMSRHRHRRHRYRRRYRRSGSNIDRKKKDVKGNC